MSHGSSVFARFVVESKDEGFVSDHSRLSDALRSYASELDRGVKGLVIFDIRSPGRAIMPENTAPIIDPQQYHGQPQFCPYA